MLRALAIVLLLFLFHPFSQDAHAASQTYSVTVEGMHCKECAEMITSAISKVPNIDAASVKVNLKGKTATLTMKDDNPKTVEDVKNAVSDAGYKLTKFTPIKSGSAN